MKVYATKEFARIARKEGVRNQNLCEAIAHAERGLIGARIGRFLIKQRVARQGQGRSGGFRTIVFHRVGEQAVFLHIFAKSDKANLSDAEEDAGRGLTAASGPSSRGRG